VAVQRIRLDDLLVQLGLEPNRNRARGRILAGDVRIGDRIFDKPGTAVSIDARPELRERPRFVSRGGEKLSGALDALRIDPAGRDCIDVGASTGGFTDCLLQRGARSVLALDVGYGQLAMPLRQDPRVVVVERTNARYFTLPEGMPPRDLLTADVSFISLAKLLPSFRAWLRVDGEALVMVKPQFELEQGLVGGGVVRDPELRARALERVRAAALELGFAALGDAESVLPGPKGNIEHFLWLRR
jgi:23S rRNA (cytidine1920-2'-O)/16S rRNA (cytidine1409-2'-O)-methyltransferase